MTHNSYDNTASRREAQRPYMTELQEQMDIQLKRQEEYIGRIHNAADRVRAVQSRPEDPAKKEESIPGYLGTLASRIDIMRVMNDRLEYLVNHLEGCI